MPLCPCGSELENSLIRGLVIESERPRGTSRKHWVRLGLSSQSDVVSVFRNTTLSESEFKGVELQ